MAASRTVDAQFHPHSLHCYFLYAADKDKPLIYDVIKVRDGRSFCTRFVRAIQGGKTIFTASISFQVIEPDSIAHQAQMPDVPPPDQCEKWADFKHRVLHEPDTISEGGRLALKAYGQVLDLPEVFALKLITPREYIKMPTDRPMKFACWVKSNADIGDDKYLHHCVAAFVSDIAPIGTPIAAHAAAGFRLGMAASLDHSMWIHRHDFRIDNDWLLYETESTVAAASRALIHGKMWTRDGRMVLSTCQEIMVRAQREEEIR